MLHVEENQPKKSAPEAYRTEAVLALPPAFVGRMEQILGNEAQEFFNTYDRERVQALRLNPLKKGVEETDAAKILSALSIPEAEPVPWTLGAYYYSTGERGVREMPVGKEETKHVGMSEHGKTCQPGRHPFHEMGLYYIQEPSAMAPATLLAPRPGERVLDLCAAPGGKSTQLAAMMGQQGLLVANEIHPARARILSRNIERMGIANAIVTNADSGQLAERFAGFFHRILVDAPCSGEGMFRKNPEAMEEWSAENVAKCAARQREILENAARMLLPGGRLVYSTCTFAPEENEQVIGGFLERHPDYTVERLEAPWFDEGRPDWGNGDPALSDTFRLWPHRLQGEGHYAAVLRRAGAGDDHLMLREENHTVDSAVLRCGAGIHTAGGGKRRSGKGNPDRQQAAALEEFAGEVLSEETRALLMETGVLRLNGERLWWMPCGTPMLSGINVLREGLEIGTFKKNRFEPAHALALFLGREQVRQAVELEESAILSYLRGESVAAEGKKGWNLVCYGGYSAGWGKLSGGQLKNHYPKGLRTECIL